MHHPRDAVTRSIETGMPLMTFILAQWPTSFVAAIIVRFLLAAGMATAGMGQWANAEVRKDLVSPGGPRQSTSEMGMGISDAHDLCPSINRRSARFVDQGAHASPSARLAMGRTALLSPGHNKAVVRFCLDENLSGRPSTMAEKTGSSKTAIMTDALQADFDRDVAVDELDERFKARVDKQVSTRLHRTRSRDFGRARRFAGPLPISGHHFLARLRSCGTRDGTATLEGVRRAGSTAGLPEADELSKTFLR
jgi:hypothetical protein